MTAADEHSVQIAKLNAITWNYAIFVVFVTLIKIVALVIGYYVVRLGYNTMMSGVKGDDSVEVGAFGTRFKFKGVTPGLALGIIGVLMMGWALSTRSQFSANLGSETIVRQIEGTGGESEPKAVKGGGDENERDIGRDTRPRPPKFPEDTAKKPPK